MYAERLADDMGLYSSDVARLGTLAGDSTRASWLVVNTGIHVLGWSRQRAVDFLRGNTPMPPVDIDRKVDATSPTRDKRWPTWWGRLEIERIRAKARGRWAKRFDIRDSTAPCSATAICRSAR